MNKIVYDRALMQVMSLFESVTRAALKDCIKTSSGFIFVVAEHEIGKAVGARGRNVRLLEQKLKTRIKIVEFSDDPVSFIKNLIYPLQAVDVSSVDGALVVTAPDHRTRGLLIGRSAEILRSHESIVKRYFPVTKMRVV